MLLGEAVVGERRDRRERVHEQVAHLQLLERCDELLLADLGAHLRPVSHGPALRPARRRSARTVAPSASRAICRSAAFCSGHREVRRRADLAPRPARPTRSAARAGRAPGAPRRARGRSARRRGRSGSRATVFSSISRCGRSGSGSPSSSARAIRAASEAASAASACASARSGWASQIRISTVGKARCGRTLHQSWVCSSIEPVS